MENVQNNFSKAFQKDNTETKIYHASELFGNNSEISIRYQDQLYRIRITRNGKLIMNK